jgi:ComF family protein
MPLQTDYNASANPKGGYFGIGQLFRAIKDAAFPTRCLGCGQLYRPPTVEAEVSEPFDPERRFQHLVADALCSGCARIEWAAAPLCTACGRPFATSSGLDHRCTDCLKHPYCFDRARSVGLYGNALQLLVSFLKYQGAVQLAAPLGRLMWDHLKTVQDMEEIDRIVPVPLHWRRLRRRGFNQAELLLRHWPGLIDGRRAAVMRGKVAVNALVRIRFTASQTGLGPKERQQNLRNAFEVKHPEQMKGCRVLLVDDVFTTGATVDACARALKRSGVAAVHVFTLARAV